MQPDPALYIIAATLIGGTLGFIAAALLASRRAHRISRDAWNQARLFYTLQNREPRL